MRKFLLILIISSVTLSAKAQFFGKKWVNGHYYDLNGQKHVGLILWSPPFKDKKIEDDKIFFKSDKKDLESELSSNLIKSFVMGKDSFVVSKNPSIKYAPFLKAYHDGKTKFYVSTTSKQSGPMVPSMRPGALPMGMGMGIGLLGGDKKSTYYYGPNADDTNPLEGKNFREVMSALMADKPWVVKKIKDRSFTINYLAELLEYYETDKIPESMFELKQ